MNHAPFQILAIAGSLRRLSYNKGLLRAAQELAPPGVEMQLYELHAIPLFNQDVQEQGEPPPVRAFKAAIQQADALLIATPEYNYSIPGVLKNAIDWASRPAASSPLRHKPLALLGASTGGFGTVRAQLALRQVFVYTESFVLLKPEVLVSKAADKFDATGRLTDEPTRDHIRAQIVALMAWAQQLQAGTPTEPGGRPQRQPARLGRKVAGR